MRAALLEAANVTFVGALATYVGAAAPAGELARLSVTLRRLRHHLTIPDTAEMAVRR